MKHLPSIFLAAAALVVTAAPPLAAAGITIALTPASATAGSTGNSFEVDLINLGSSTINLGGFSFELSIANPNITLTTATTATTAVYVFSGVSLFGPTISTSSGQALDASDIDDIALSGTTINSGATFGLGRVFFNVSSNASPGVTAVTFSAFPSTSLSDAAGNNLLIGTLSPGQITIVGSTVPEPSTPFLVSLAGIALLAHRSKSLHSRK